MPRPLRAALRTGIAVVSAYATLMVVFLVIDKSRFDALAGFLALTLVAGRESAMLLAFEADPSPGVFWIALTAVLGDVAALLLLLPAVWWGLERLREAPIIGGILFSIERSALEHRHLLDRWGITGLAVIVLLPALGTGPLMAGSIGLIARMPLKRLLVVLGAATTAINIVWAIVLGMASKGIPDQGPFAYIPVAILVVVGLLTIRAVWKGRKNHRTLAISMAPGLTKSDISALQRYGINDVSGLLYVNCDLLGAKLGIKKARLGTCRNASELLLLPSVEPMDAERLMDMGIRSITDLAVAPPAMLAAACAESQMHHDEMPNMPKLALEARTFLGRSL